MIADPFTPHFNHRRPRHKNKTQKHAYPQLRKREQNTPQITPTTTPPLSQPLIQSPPAPSTHPPLSSPPPWWQSTSPPKWRSAQTQAPARAPLANRSSTYRAPPRHTCCRSTDLRLCEWIHTHTHTHTECYDKTTRPRAKSSVFRVRYGITMICTALSDNLAWE